MVRSAHPTKSTPRANSIPPPPPPRRRRATFELAQNQLGYTVLRASRGGVVTKVAFEIGQVVAAGQPGVAVADDGEPEIVVDVPEEHLEQFKRSKFRAFLASAPADVVRRRASRDLGPGGSTDAHVSRTPEVRSRHGACRSVRARR